jgi:hypothetical protein
MKNLGRKAQKMVHVDLKWRIKFLKEDEQENDGEDGYLAVAFWGSNYLWGFWRER